LAMEHHWVSDGSGRRHRITVIMESRRNGPQLSTRRDDDDEYALSAVPAATAGARKNCR